MLISRDQFEKEQIQFRIIPENLRGQTADLSMNFENASLKLNWDRYANGRLPIAVDMLDPSSSVRNSDAPVETGRRLHELRAIKVTSAHCLLPLNLSRTQSGDDLFQSVNPMLQNFELFANLRQFIGGSG